MITATFNEDRSNLILTVDAETQQYLQREQAEDEKFDTDSYMHDLFDGFIANSEYAWISPATCGDLTDAPILGILSEEQKLPEGVTYDDGSGWLVSGPGLGHRVEERWGWMMYQIQSLQAELAEKGRAVLIS